MVSPGAVRLPVTPLLIYVPMRHERFPVLFDTLLAAMSWREGARDVECCCGITA